MIPESVPEIRVVDIVGLAGRLTGRDFGTPRRVFAPEQADRARFRHSQACFRAQSDPN